MSLEVDSESAADESPIAEPVASVELRGIMAAPGREPRLSLHITRPDGTDSRLDVGVGDSVYDGWTALEFNPEHQTLTLSKEGRYLVLRRGEPVRLRSSR